MGIESGRECYCPADHEEFFVADQSKNGTFLMCRNRAFSPTRLFVNTPPSQRRFPILLSANDLLGLHQAKCA